MAKQTEPGSVFAPSAGYATSVDAALAVADSIRADDWLDEPPLLAAFNIGEPKKFTCPTDAILDAACMELAAEVRRLREVEKVAAELLKFVDDCCDCGWSGTVGECPDDKLRALLKAHNAKLSDGAKQAEVPNV